MVKLSQAEITDALLCYWNGNSEMEMKSNLTVIKVKFLLAENFLSTYFYLHIVA